jgi:hypothetical protein
MEKKIAGLLGAAATLGTLNAAQASPRAAAITIIITTTIITTASTAAIIEIARH